MKQQITHKQLNELSPKVFDWLVVNYWPEGRLDRTNQDLEPEDFTIGQMIEFVGEHEDHEVRGYHIVGWDDDQELCDVLWEQVKAVLEAKN